jgi:FHS family L-fucose permease-like MFS transporter
MMIVSVFLDTFSAMLLGLFIVALGFSLQQTSANPFMIALGDEKTGSNRINLGGGINSLGTTLGPIIVSFALFGTSASISDEQISNLSLSKVIVLYACVGALFVGVAALFGLSKKVPSGKLENQEEQEETVKKSVFTMLVITVLLSACFVPVFSSYRSDAAMQLNELNHDLEQLQVDENNQPITTLSASQLETKSTIEAEITKVKEPLDQHRMLFLSLGIAVVIGGIIVATRSARKNATGWGALKYPQLSLGMIAIFVYVGVEVAVGSNLGELLKHEKFGAHAASEITPFISMYWGSLMIGRWSGAINAFNLSNQTKFTLKFIVPFVAFAIVILASKLSGYQVDSLYWYVLCVAVQVLAFVATKDKPVRTLAVFGTLGVISLLLGLFGEGDFAIYSFLSAGLFCSIMWPCIFSLSLAGLGKYQAQGSGFLVMMILGGALIPPFQGKLSDIIGIQPSFIVGVVCFAYITFFALFVNRQLKSQGISMDENE